MNKEEKKGMGQRIKGTAKEAAGRMTNDEELETEGKADQVVGRGREKAGEATRKVGEKLDDLGDRLTRCWSLRISASRPARRLRELNAC